MKLIISMLLLAMIAISPASYAGDDDKLFINLTSDEAWRADMAMAFANANLQKGHQVTVFLNVRGVYLASTRPGQDSSGKAGSEGVATVLANGGTVIVCPMCMKRAGLTSDDLIEGVIMGGPTVTFPAMYDSDVQMSY